MQLDVTQQEKQLLDFLRELPSDYRGGVELHFDGSRVARWKKVQEGAFPKIEDEAAGSDVRRRVVVRRTEV